jgi:nucleotide-binding universal stress UspA family protein
MYRKIIIGHDLHDGGSDALALGRLIAEASGAKLVVAGVFPMGILPHGFTQQWREHEEGIAGEIEAIADEAGAEPEAFPSSSPGRGLHDLAEESGADLVVIGASRHSKVGEIVAGNVGLGLLHGAPAATGTARPAHSDRSPLGSTALRSPGSPSRTRSSSPAQAAPRSSWSRSPSRRRSSTTRAAAAGAATRNSSRRSKSTCAPSSTRLPAPSPTVSSSRRRS